MSQPLRELLEFLEEEDDDDMVLLTTPNHAHTLPVHALREIGYGAARAEDPDRKADLQYLKDKAANEKALATMEHQEQDFWSAVSVFNKVHSYRKRPTKHSQAQEVMASNEVMNVEDLEEVLTHLRPRKHRKKR